MLNVSLPNRRRLSRYSRNKGDTLHLGVEAPLLEHRSERLQEREDEGVTKATQERQEEDDGLEDEHGELRVYSQQIAPCMTNSTPHSPDAAR